MTAALAWWVVNYIDQVIFPVVRDALGIEISFPGLGLIILVVTITFIGALTAGLLGRWLVGLGESIVKRMPVVRSVYGAVKQILETVLGEHSNAFRQAVLVQYPRKGLWAIAFVTASTQGELQRLLGGEHVNVFLPTTPNPTSGFLLMVPREEVVALDMSVEEAVRLVISAGIAAPEEHLAGAERILAGRMTKAEVERRLYGSQEEEHADS